MVKPLSLCHLIPLSCGLIHSTSSTVVGRAGTVAPVLSGGRGIPLLRVEVLPRPKEGGWTPCCVGITPPTFLQLAPRLGIMLVDSLCSRVCRSPRVPRKPFAEAQPVPAGTYTEKEKTRSHYLLQGHSPNDVTRSLTLGSKGRFILYT